MRNSTLPCVSTRATYPKYVCASERVKLIGTTDARFPDFGHHLEKEMGGLWLHPIKLLDGFWLRLKDKSADCVDTWLIADEFELSPCGTVFRFGGGMGHTNLVVTQRQICPEEAAGLVVSYEIHNRGKKSCHVELEFLARTDLRPVWFSDVAGISKSAQDTGEWLADKALFLARDPGHEWYAAIGGDRTPDQIKTGDPAGPEQTAGQGISVSLSYELTVAPHTSETLCFFIAGSHQSRADCMEQYAILAEPGAALQFEESKRVRYENLLNQTCLTSPDLKFNEVFDWIKIHTDWLTVDTGGFGRGLAAGFPEYPWWFGCDNCYALQGVLAMGDFQLCRDTLLLLLEYSERHNGNGKILHEVTTMGVCANPGNTQETAHFIVMLWLYFEWTGDFSLVERASAYLKKSVQWLRSQDANDEGFPEGYGIIEIAGLNSRMIDTAVYTAEAYRAFSKICRITGENAAAEEYEALSQKHTDAINTRMWNEKSGLYCDAFTSVDEVQKSMDAILEKRYNRNAEQAEELINAAILEKQADGSNSAKSGWLLNRNWVINTPMEMGLAEREKAETALKNMHTSDYIGPYGMYLSGIYQDATMTISTGVMATAQSRYGHTDRALELLERMFSTFGMISAGCFAEMSPDYGCFIQGWTAYAAFVPVVRYFFGVQPQIDVKDSGFTSVLILNPCPPERWPEAAVANVPVLDGILSLGYKRENGKHTYQGSFSGKAPLKWQIGQGISYRVNGAEHQAGTLPAFIDISSGNFTIEEL